jgi:hypothetical protein
MRHYFILFFNICHILTIGYSMSEYSTIPKPFLLSALTGSQIWLNPLMDDHHQPTLPHKFEPKKHRFNSNEDLTTGLQTPMYKKGLGFRV